MMNTEMPSIWLSSTTLSTTVRELSKLSWICLLGISGTLCFLSGCGGQSGIERVGVTGSVTFEGKPVPFGSVKFEPDRKRGGTGPSGFAQIIDGRFDTQADGRGSVKGPVIVTIQGVATDAVYAPQIFQPYQTTAEISSEGKPLSFEVPTELKIKRKKNTPEVPGI